MSRKEKGIRDESTADGKRIWAAVDTAASKAPQWIKYRVDQALAGTPSNSLTDPQPLRSDPSKENS